jgi:hypothetical protein
VTRFWLEGKHRLSYETWLSLFGDNLGESIMGFSAQLHLHAKEILTVLWWGLADIGCSSLRIDVLQFDKY